MISPSQKSNLARILSEETWVETQFGYKDLYSRLYEALGNATDHQFNYIKWHLTRRKNMPIRDTLINLGLKI
jgi:hypothetical protein